MFHPNIRSKISHTTWNFFVSFPAPKLLVIAANDHNKYAPPGRPSCLNLFPSQDYAHSCVILASFLMAAVGEMFEPSEAPLGQGAYSASTCPFNNPPNSQDWP